MSKEKGSGREPLPPLEEHSEYDDPKKRKKLRFLYRELMNKTKEKKEELENPQSTELIQVLAQQEHLFDKVRHTREAVIDADLLHTVANRGKEQAKQLQTDFVIFDPKDFADKLVNYMAQNRLEAQLSHNRSIDADDEEARDKLLESLDWMKLGKKCAGCFKRVPTVDFMLGPLVIEVPEGKVRKRIARRNDKVDASQKQAPQELSKVEEQEEATTKEVERVYRVLKRQTKDGSQPVGFFEFITNPSSFAQTIENLFHLSFLVKDGKAEIKMDSDGQPTICKSNPYREQDHQDVIAQKQIIMSMTMSDWKEIIEVYEIEEPQIPPRTA